MAAVGSVHGDSSYPNSKLYHRRNYSTANEGQFTTAGYQAPHFHIHESVNVNPKLVNSIFSVCEAQETTIQVLPVNDATLQSLVLESDLLVLVEFWAPWCGPCRTIHPITDELAKDYTAKLTGYKGNTDESPSIATQYGIRSIPTIMVFKGGEKKDAVIGAVPKSMLCTCVEKVL